MLKETIKKILGSVYFFNHRFLFKQDNLTIFLFHEITNHPSDFQKNFNIYHSIEEFEKIINWIVKNYNIISPTEILDNKKNKALITFDDGYLGSFENGIPILKKYEIPSVHFLNSRPIIKEEPNIVSTIDFLAKNDNNFQNYMLSNNINVKENSIYEIKPEIFRSYKNKYKLPLSEIKQYQGKIVNVEHLISQKNNSLVYFGNHFYDHWNIIKLSHSEIEKYYIKNKINLKLYENYIDIVSFTHGVPKINFSNNNLQQIAAYKPLFIFYSGGGTSNYTKLVYDRTFTSYNEIINKTFYYRKNKKYKFDKIFNSLI